GARKRAAAHRCAGRKKTRTAILEYRLRRYGRKGHRGLWHECSTEVRTAVPFGARGTLCAAARARPRMTPDEHAARILAGGAALASAIFCASAVAAQASQATRRETTGDTRGSRWVLFRSCSGLAQLRNRARRAIAGVRA